VSVATAGALAQVARVHSWIGGAVQVVEAIARDQPETRRSLERFVVSKRTLVRGDVTDAKHSHRDFSARLAHSPARAVYSVACVHPDEDQNDD
jgi:hypothetical protein